MDVKALIEAVKAYPILYRKQDSSSSGPGDQKSMIWMQISNQLNQPPDKCKAKWRNLKDSYQKAIKWKRELEELGKLKNYHGYRHEEALNFLESSISDKKRKSDGDDRQLKTPKKPRIVYCPESQDADYYDETDPTDNENNEVDHEEVGILENPKEYAEQIEELTDEGPKSDIQGLNEEQFICFESANDDTASSHHEPYQESFANDNESSSTLELDLWLSGVKETLMSFPKLLRARAKRQINNLVSDFEIKYLESIDNEKA